MAGGTRIRRYFRRRERRFPGAALFAAAAVFLTPEALAADYELVAVLGADTKGVFRGIKSEHLNPSGYGYAELLYGEILAGVFANPVKIQGEVSPLVLTYAAWKPSVDKLDFEIGARYYAFPGTRDFTFDLNRDGTIDHAGHKGLFEAQVGVRRRFERGRIHLRAFYTPDDFAETGPAFYLNAEARAHIARGFEARGSVGVSEYKDARFSDDYVDYRVSLHKSVLGFDAFVAYSNTVGLDNADNNAVVFGIERVFTIAESDDPEWRRFEKIRNDWRIDKALLSRIR